MGNVLHRLARFVSDIAAGVDAGHAVRHGLPAPDRARRPATAPEDPGPPRPACTAWCRIDNGVCFPSYPGPRLPGPPRRLTRDGCREVN